jgi:alkylation response protein AidB-like acyl-CoA dehydrogenase
MRGVSRLGPARPDGPPRARRLNGKKFYCTGSLAGDVTFGPCRVDGSDEVRVFLTPTDAEGVTIHDDWSGFGQRTTASGTTELDDVWIPDELCLASPDTDGGGGGAITSLNYQAVHTGVFVGIARNALDDAVEFVRSRARLWYESDADVIRWPDVRRCRAVRERPAAARQGRCQERRHVQPVRGRAADGDPVLPDRHRQDARRRAARLGDLPVRLHVSVRGHLQPRVSA